MDQRKQVRASWCHQSPGRRQTSLRCRQQSWPFRVPLNLRRQKKRQLQNHQRSKPANFILSNCKQGNKRERVIVQAVCLPAMFSQHLLRKHIFAKWVIPWMFFCSMYLVFNLKITRDDGSNNWFQVHKFLQLLLPMPPIL